MKNKKNIELVMNILESHFSDARRTTLNRMRLEKIEPFRILISCLLSLRTRDENTEKVSEKLFKIADTPKKIAGMNVKKLEKIIYSSGHYKKKARVLKSVSRELIEKFNKKVPDNKDDLLSIKGVGPKTANVVLSFAFGKNVIPVDVNVHRVVNRLGWVNTKIPEKTEKELEKIIPKKYWREFNGIFLLFGKTICQPISPFCSKCPVEKYCLKIGVGRRR